MVVRGIFVAVRASHHDWRHVGLPSGDPRSALQLAIAARQLLHTSGIPLLVKALRLLIMQPEQLVRHTTGSKLVTRRRDAQPTTSSPPPCASVISLLMPYASRHDAAEHRQRVLHTELDRDEATEPAG
jgi:hypothetical protein